MSPKQVDKTAGRLRTLMSEDENAPDDESFEARGKRRKEMAHLGFELAIGAAHNLAILAAK